MTCPVLQPEGCCIPDLAKESQPASPDHTALCVHSQIQRRPPHSRPALGTCCLLRNTSPAQTKSALNFDSMPFRKWDWSDDCMHICYISHQRLCACQASPAMSTRAVMMACNLCTSAYCTGHHVSADSVWETSHPPVYIQA